MVIDSINQSLELAQNLATEFPSRELSLTITKLEEASHWAEALRRKQEELDVREKPNLPRP